jgi:hypothetical protein
MNDHEADAKEIRAEAGSQKNFRTGVRPAATRYAPNRPGELWFPDIG